MLPQPLHGTASKFMYTIFVHGYVYHGGRNVYMNLPLFSVAALGLFVTKFLASQSTMCNEIFGEAGCKLYSRTVHVLWQLSCAYTKTEVTWADEIDDVSPFIPSQELYHALCDNGPFGCRARGPEV